MDKIELLDTNLLNNKYVKTISSWCKLLGVEIGWHYYLDLVWILTEIDSLRLPKNSIIVDAGAGYGILQYILASKGYNIISLDMNRRELPLLLKILFRTSFSQNTSITNNYTTHLNKINKSNKLKITFPDIQKIILYLQKLIVSINFGHITYIQNNFTDIHNISNNSIDALVSLSAIEHNKKLKDMHISINEFLRIIKPKSSLIITTSYSSKLNWFHAPSKGWCFNKTYLIKLFKFSSNITNNLNQYKQIFHHLNTSLFLKKHTPSYYQNNPDCGMPFGKWNIKYLPVGIVKTKT